MIHYCQEKLSGSLSKKGVKKAIKSGSIRLNNFKVEEGRYVKNGDTIQWFDLEIAPPKAYNLRLKIIYEDEDIAAIYKPAGILVSGNQFKTIQNALIDNISPSKKQDALPWPLPVHRLDFQTSGILLIAKTRTARVELGQCFEEKTIQKTYYALVIGTPEEKGKIATSINDKASLTYYERVTTVQSLKNGTLSLLKLTPKTGRKHQLRIHCQSIGHPILGDKIYGKEGDILKNKGLFLTATGIKLNHPITKKELSLKTEIPSKFERRLKNEQRRFNHYHL